MWLRNIYRKIAFNLSRIEGGCREWCSTANEFYNYPACYKQINKMWRDSWTYCYFKNAMPKYNAVIHLWFNKEAKRFKRKFTHPNSSVEGKDLKPMTLIYYTFFLRNIKHHIWYQRIISMSPYVFMNMTHIHYLWQKRSLSTSLFPHSEK